jgi:hypothetical protein
MAAEISPEADEVVWCPSCGIPHEAGATHCSFCHPPLAQGAVGDELDFEGMTEAEEARTGALGRAIAGRVATQRPPRGRRASPWALPKRLQPLSEDEIEARAAAIVAQASKEEASGAAVPLFTDGSGPVSEDELLRQLDFLPPLRQRDRDWLLAGIFCCVILILGAVVIARYFAA